MIDADSKTNSFLKAIERYADEQKNMMKAEVEAFRKEQLDRANEEGSAAAYAFIQKEKADFKSALAKEYSLRETQLKRELFAKRAQMANSVFDEARKRLEEYTGSADYSEYMTHAAVSISGYTGARDVVVYIAEKDKRYADTIRSHFAGKCEVAFDRSIRLGGIRCSCEELSTVADETLDSKLDIAKRNFVNTSGFTIG